MSVVELKPNIRRCTACGVKLDRNSLIRILQDHKTHEFIVRASSKQFGRSIYVCDRDECKRKLSKHKRYRDKVDWRLL